MVPLSWGSTENNALPCCSFLSFSSFQGVFVVTLQTPKSSTTQKSDDKMGTTCCQPLLPPFPENLKGCACVFPMAGIYEWPLYPQNPMAEVAEGRKKKVGVFKAAGQSKRAIMRDCRSPVACRTIMYIWLACSQQHCQRSGTFLTVFEKVFHCPFGGTHKTLNMMTNNDRIISCPVSQNILRYH